MSTKLTIKLLHRAVYLLQVAITVLIVLGQIAPSGVAIAKSLRPSLPEPSPAIPVIEPPYDWSRGLFETWESYFARIAERDEQRLRTALITVVQEILNGSAEYQTDEELYRRIAYYVSDEYIMSLIDALSSPGLGWQSPAPRVHVADPGMRAQHPRQNATPASVPVDHTPAPSNATPDTPRVSDTSSSANRGASKVLYKLVSDVLPETASHTREAPLPTEPQPTAALHRSKLHAALPEPAPQPGKSQFSILSPVSTVNAGVIPVTADVITSGMGITRASGSLVLGDYFPLSGDVTWNSTVLTGTGILTMSTPVTQVALFDAGYFTVSTASGIIVPGDSDISVFQIEQVSGFDAFSVTVSAIDLAQGTVTGTANITLTTPGVYAVSGGQVTAAVSFVMLATPTGIQYTGSVESLTLIVGGMTFQADGVSLSDEGIGAAAVTLTAPALFGSASASVNDLLISPSGVSLGGAGIAFNLPDLAYGDGSKLKLTNNRATLGYAQGDYEFTITSTLAISLPANVQNISATVKLAYVDGESQLTGSLDNLSLTVAGSTLAMRDLAFDNSGVSVVSATLTLPPSLGSASATISATSVTSAGLSFAQAQITLPDINIGDGKLVVSDIAATLTSEETGYAFDAEGTLNVTLPGTSAQADFAFALNPQGEASGQVASLNLIVAGSTLAMRDLAFDNSGVSVVSATLTLPPSLGSASATISATSVTSAGLSFAQAQINLPDINIGDGKLVVSNIAATLTSEETGYAFDAEGTLNVTLPGTSAQADLAFSIDPQGQASGLVSSLNLTVAGATLVMQNMAFDNSGVSVASATLTLPASLGSASATISGTSITSAGLTFAQAQIDFPDIRFGSGDTVKVSGAKALLKTTNERYGFDAQGTLYINLPGNPEQRIALAFSMDPDGSLRATIVELELTLAGCRLTIQNMSLGNDGLTGQNVALTLPSSLGGATGAVSGLRITADGMSFDQVSITLPNIKFGDGSKVMIKNLTATLTMASGSYALNVSGTLALRLPDNNQDISITASMDSNGNLSASIPGEVTLNIASATLKLSGVTLNNSGLTVATASLKLPNLLGGVEGALTDVRITENGLSIGGGAATVAFPNFSVGGASTNLRVTNARLQVVFVSNGATSSYKLTLSGTVGISVGGQSASTTGTISIDNHGHLSGSVSSFSLNIAGLSLSASAIQFSNDGGLSIQSASLNLPAAFGGASVLLQNVTISTSGNLSIGGGSFTLPTINVGGFQLQLNGSLLKVGNDYQISANGTVAIPGFGAALGCSGIQVGVVLYATETGQTVMEIDSLDVTSPVVYRAPVPPEVLAITGYSLKFQEATLGMTGCRIPVASTGVYITALSGRVTFDADSTQINVGLSLEAGPRLFGMAAISGDLDTTLTVDPFNLALLGTIKLFTIQVGGADATLTSNSFSANLWIDMVYLKGNLAVNAWSDYRGFHLTGSAQMTLSLDKGVIGSYCVPVPHCSTHWVSGQTCWGSGWWRTCISWSYPVVTCWFEDSCVDIPPVNIAYSVGVDVGEFSNGAWGFKGYVSILGTNYGFYIDSRKTLTFGNVDSYRLVTPATVLRAQQAAEMRAAGVELPGDLAALDYVTLNALGEIVVDVPVTQTTEAVFSLTRLGDAPTLTLLAPDGTPISPNSLPDGVTYQEFVTYTLKDSLTPSMTLSLLAGESQAQTVDGDGLRLSLCAPQTPANGQATPVGSIPVPERIARTLGDEWDGVAIQLPTAMTEGEEAVAQLRFVHAWPDAGAVDVWVDGDPYAGGLGRYALSRYTALGVGEHVIQVTPAGITTTVLLSTTVALAEYTDYSLVLTGEYDYWLLVDENRPLPQDHALLRLVNVAPGAPAVDLTDPEGGYLTGNVPFEAAGPYVELSGGRRDVQVRLADQSTVLVDTSALTLTRGSIYSVFLVGTESITPGLQLVASHDAAPPAQVRFVNAVAGGDALDVLHIWPGVTTQSSLVWDSIPYSQTTAYASVPGESAHLIVTPAGISTTHLISLTVSLEEGEAYTLIAAGWPGSVSPIWLHDDNRSSALVAAADGEMASGQGNNRLPALGQAHLRLVALSPDAPAVDLAVQGGPVLLESVAYGSASDYISLAGGDYDLEIRQAGSATVLVSLPSAVLTEGYVYSVFLLGASGDQRAMLNTDIATDKSTQVMYQITQAQVGTWQAILGGDITPDTIYVFKALGTVPAPKLNDVSVTLRDAITVEVTWRLTSPQADTRISIFANPGPITTTAVVTNSDGVPETVEIPYYAGRRLADRLGGVDDTWVNGSLQTHTVNLLSNLPSGTYHIWIEVVDGRNPPTRLYIPDPIEVVLPWEDTWHAGLAAVSHYRALEVTWQDHVSADVDQYVLYASDPSTQTMQYELGDVHHFTLMGLDPALTYTLWIDAIDTRTGRIAHSEQITAWPRSAPFSLSVDPPGLTLSNGESRTITVTLRTALPDYPDIVRLHNVDEEALWVDGVDMYVTFAQDTITPTQAGAVVTGTVFAPKAAASGSWSEGILAMGGGDQRYVHLPVTVTNPTIDLRVTPDHVVLGEAESVSVTLDVLHFQNHTDPVELYVEGPEDLLYTLNQGGPAAQSTIILPGRSAVLWITDTQRAFSTGNGVIELWAVSPQGSDYQRVHYQIAKPDFRVERPPDRPVGRINILVGESITLPFESRVLNGWTQPLTVTYLQHTVIPSTTVRLYADDGTLLDTHAPITPPLSMYLQVDSTPDTPLSTQGYALEVCGTNVRSDCAQYDVGVYAPGAIFTDLFAYLDKRVQAGDLITYTWHVGNEGPLAVTNVTMKITLPPSTTLFSVGQGACVLEDEEIVCDLGIVPRQSRSVIEATLRAAPGTNINLVSLEGPCSLTADQEDLDRGDTELCVDPLPQQDYDLAVSLSSAADQVFAGQSLVYTITVSNAGPGPASQVNVKSSLPWDVTLEALDPRCLPYLTDVFCNLDSLAAGEIATFQLSTRLPSNIGGILVNAARVSSLSGPLDPVQGFDTNLDNNYATLYTHVREGESPQPPGYPVYLPLVLRDM